LTLLCDVDIPEWESKNRVTLHQQRTNIWLISCLNNGNATGSSLAGDIENAFGDWFESSLDMIAKIFDKRVKIGTADNIKKLIINKFPTNLGKPEKTREEMDPIPLLAPGNVVNVLVTFDYRGTTPSIPWPVYNKGFISRARCPIGADVMLTASFKPTTISPPEKSDSEIFGTTTDNVISATTIPLLITSAVIIVGGLAYLKSKK